MLETLAKLSPQVQSSAQSTMAKIRVNLGALTLAVVAMATCGAGPGHAAELWFDVTADTRVEQSLGVSVPDSSFQPVHFTLRMDLDPVFSDAWDTYQPGYSRTIKSYFQGPSYATSTPFNAEMETYNIFGLTGVDLSPWYHGTTAAESWTSSTPPSGVVVADVSYALSNVPIADNRMYVHTLSLRATNPTLTVPPDSLDEMSPWTQERLLAFISHADTVWQFVERAWSQDSDLSHGPLTYYQGVYYTGTAQPIPEPATFALLLAAAALACWRPRRGRRPRATPNPEGLPG
jgi:hypothetical protein